MYDHHSRFQFLNFDKSLKLDKDLYSIYINPKIIGFTELLQSEYETCSSFPL